MDAIQTFLSEEYITSLFEKFKTFGIFIAILLPFLESFIPVLPIALFAVVNVNSYGLVYGFLLTWTGATLGSIMVFLIIRRYGQHKFLSRLNRHPHTLKFIRRVDEKGVMPLFLLLCFPFTPSSLVNIVAGLSTISKKLYISAVILAKAVMLFTLSFIGNDIYSFVREPKKSIIIVIILLVLWIVGKWLESRIHEE